MVNSAENSELPHLSNTVSHNKGNEWSAEDNLTWDKLIRPVAAIIRYTLEQGNEFRTGMWMNYNVINIKACRQAMNIIAELVMETKHPLESILENRATVHIERPFFADWTAECHERLSSS